MTEEQFLKIAEDLRERIIEIGEYLKACDGDVWIWCHGNGSSDISTDGFKYSIYTSGEEKLEKTIRKTP